MHTHNCKRKPTHAHTIAHCAPGWGHSRRPWSSAGTQTGAASSHWRLWPAGHQGPM